MLLPDEGPSLWPVFGMFCIAAAVVLFNLGGFKSKRL